MDNQCCQAADKKTVGLHPVTVLDVHHGGQHGIVLCQ
jgi:hypothetical protein